MRVRVYVITDPAGVTRRWSIIDKSLAVTPSPGIHDLIVTVRADKLIVADELRAQVLPLEICVNTARHCPMTPLSSYTQMDDTYLHAYAQYSFAPPGAASAPVPVRTPSLPHAQHISFNHRKVMMFA